MTSTEPLTGFTVGITAARRREELGALLERRGARVMYAPALRIVPLADDTRLLEATNECLTGRLDAVVATTGIGFRGWMEAAEGWGLGGDLLDRLGRVRLLARGPKARGAVRAAGLVEEWSPASEEMAELVQHLLREDLSGVRVAVQLHGEPQPDVVEALRAAGAQVVEVPVYRWVPPEDSTPVHRLIDAILARNVDAVTFTSAPAAASLLKHADDSGRLEPMLDALSADVLPACVGMVTAAPLERHGLRPIQPERPRLGSLARVLTEQLPLQHEIRLTVAGRDLRIRGHAAVVDGELRAVPPTPMAILRALAVHPGHVVSSDSLRLVLPGGNDSNRHAAEMAVARLRSALGDPAYIESVVKRGYRLACDPPRTALQEAL